MLQSLDFLQFLMWVEFSLACKVYQLKDAVTAADFFFLRYQLKESA